MNFLAVVTESTGISIGVLALLATGIITLVGGGFKLFYEWGRAKQRIEDIEDRMADKDTTLARLLAKYDQRFEQDETKLGEHSTAIEVLKLKQGR